PSGQMIAWGATSTGTYGYWHRLVRLPDGSWLRVFTVFPSDTRFELVIQRSTDNARTWTPYARVSDGERRMDNGFLHFAPNGDLLLGGRSNVFGQSYKIVQYRSKDFGKTWAREADLDSAGVGIKGLWEPYYQNLADGRMINIWADETYPNLSQVLVQRVSADSGRTWGPETVVVQDGAAGRPGMPAITRMTNGQYFLAYEACGPRNCQIYYKRSANGWQWPTGPGTPIPGQYCGPFVMSLPDGRLVLSSCRETTDMTKLVKPVSWSEDFGTTWRTNSPAIIDGAVDGYWVAMYQTGSNEIAYVSGDRIRFGNFVPR
ncbi:MAG TPA: sialidase family protein, partial [Candidatus Saccharimonadales bacterium]|nr:sialidase family protein [Candidatus Saccharimonadales bacterium]